MATANGVNGALSLPTHSDSANLSLSAKRKREDSTNGDSNGSAPLTQEESHALIRDLIDVLKVHDTTPSILNRPLPERASSDEPHAKRQKPEGSADPTTILTRHSSNSYSTLEEVFDDIDAVVSDITDKLQLPKSANSPAPPSPSQTETSLKIAAFKKRAHELIQREKTAKKQQMVSGGAEAEEGSSLSTSAGVDGASGEDRLLLTLYGTAGPSSKQLFSSLQLPTKVAGETKDIVQTLRESGLPNGITTTKIVPMQSAGLIDDKKRVPTLGELFPTPPTVPQLQPPKVSKIAVTRSSTVGWYQPASADPHSRSGSYFKQPISTGQWLDYSNSSPAAGSKRKQRDRALSLGAAKAPQMDIDSIESGGAKLENLFRGAYSSFAPCKDDAAAIVPGGIIDRIWYQHVGEKSFERFVQNASNLEDIVDPDVDSTNIAVADCDDEVEKFREAVENFEGSIDPNLESVVEKAADEKDVDEVLEEVSDLLRTLNSHQRNRLLMKESRAVGLLNGPDTTSLGTLSKPSDPEISIYEILKSQLTLMIASLPPYAVAKLDSDQLAELAISTKMEIEMEDHKGVMEEDEASARARAMAFSAASASRPVQPPQHRSGSAAPYGNQYQTPRAAATAQSQYYGQGQTHVRPPQSNMQRPPAAAQVPYPSQRPAAGAPYRPGYGAPNYQVPRPQQAPYTPQPQYQQTQPNYNRPAGQPYPGVPQSAPPATMNARYPNQYGQQTPSQNVGGYQYGNGVNGARQMSPQKPMHTPQPAYNQAQPRPAYATPTASIAQDRRPYPQNPMATQMMNGGSTPSNRPQHVSQQQQLGPTNYSTFMTTAEQSTMMERQRAQLAQQQGLQQMARTTAQAATMGSPSKSQVNGSALTAGL